MLESISPFFVVGDVARSVRFYEQLGFELRWQSADAPWFAIVGRGPVQVFLKHIADDVAAQPNHALHEWAPWDAFVLAPDPDAVAAEFEGRGVTLRQPLTDRDDGLRGFEIADPDGYVLFFGRPIAEGGAE